MPTEDVCCIGWRLFGDALQGHVSLFRSPAALAMVARWAGGNHIRPDMFSAQMPGSYVIHSQADVPFPAILTGIIIAAENLTPGQLDMRTRSMHLVLEPDNGWARQQLRNSADMAAAIDNHAGFPRKNQSDGSPGRAYMDRLKVRIKYKHWLVHGAS
jgi:hypothetical protein